MDPTIHPAALFIRKDNRYQKIRIRDILYIGAAGSYLEIVTPQEKYFISQNLSQFTRKNSIASLIRVHRSYIVNMDWVDSFNHDYLYVGSIQIPIGAAYRQRFMDGIRCF